MKTSILIGLTLTLGGCDYGTAPADGPEPLKPPASMQASVVELAPLMPADTKLVGVAITPEGKRYVLDQSSGLYEIGEQAATLRFNVTGLGGIELTDVVALDSTRFALTAENDGFLLDLGSGQFDSYFCYLPSPPAQEPQGTPGGPSTPSTPVATTPLSISQTLQMEGVAVSQRTESVAYNFETRQLFAQPRTTRLDTGAVAGSELFVFEESGGEPIRVLPMAEVSFVAGGMTTAPGNRLLLGSGNEIFEQFLSGERTSLAKLDPNVAITGMARAPDGAIWVLDAIHRRLLRLDSVR